MIAYLWNGLKIALLLPRAPAPAGEEARAGRALWAAVLGLFLAYVYCSWIFIGGRPTGFNYDDLPIFGWLVFVFLMAAAAFGLIMRPAAADRTRSLAALFLFTHVWILTVSDTLYALASDYMPENLAGRNWLILIGIWHFLAYYKLLLTEERNAEWRGALGAALIVAALTGPLFWLRDPDFITVRREHFALPGLNAEDTLGRQQAMLDHALSGLRRSSPGRRDTYLIAAGLDGAQDIFRKEALFAQTVFDAGQGTGGRSLVLVNSPRSSHALPLATATNLEYALARLAHIGQPWEDTIVVYLTSHGGQDASVLTDLPGISLLPVDARMLRGALDRSGFRRRVIIVSACYAGSFIDALKTPDTLIITASARDRASFGCSDERELTRFGEAFLKDGLQGAATLPDAFEKAKARIAALERQDGSDPSDPQIYIGANWPDRRR